MKRIISLALAVLLIVVAFSSCSNKDDGGDGGTSKDEVTTDKQYQVYDELEFKSDKRFDDKAILGYDHDNGSFVAEKGTMTCITENDVGFNSPLNPANDADITMFNGLSADCGATYGQSLQDVCTSYSLDAGYAAFAGSDGSIKMYESSESVDVTAKGGCIYVGYAMDPTGKWAFMDFEMLKSVLLGQLVIQNAQVEYTVCVVSVTFDANENVSMITSLYGALNPVMQMVTLRTAK